jgi:hypothetical protein
MGPQDEMAFPIQVHPSVKALFSVAVTSEIGNGKNTLFWTDRWLHGQRLDQLVPHLYGAIASRAKKRTVCEALINRQWVSDIRGALSVAVLPEYLGLWELLSEVTLPLGTQHPYPNPYPLYLGRIRNYPSKLGYG